MLFSVAASAQTTISDTLTSDVDGYVAGQVTQVQIAWPAFRAASGWQIAAGSATVPIGADQVFAYSLQPTAQTNPQAYYTFTFAITPTGKTNVTEYYSAQVIVPISATPVTLNGCQISSAPWWAGSTSELGPQPGAAGATKLSGSISLTVGTINDGVCNVLGTAIPVTGALQGDPAPVGVWPALPAGFTASGQTTAANAVSVTVCNNSGRSQDAGTATYTAVITH